MIIVLRLVSGTFSSSPFAPLFFITVSSFVFFLSVSSTPDPSSPSYSCDGRVSSQALPSRMWTRRAVGQLDRDRARQRRFNVGGPRLQSECGHDVAHLLFCQFPVLLSAVGANEGNRFV